MIAYPLAIEMAATARAQQLTPRTPSPREIRRNKRDWKKHERLRTRVERRLPSLLGKWLTQIDRAAKRGEESIRLDVRQGFTHGYRRMVMDCGAKALSDLGYGVTKSLYIKDSYIADWQEPWLLISWRQVVTHVFRAGEAKQTVLGDIY